MVTPATDTGRLLYRASIWLRVPSNHSIDSWLRVPKEEDGARGSSVSAASSVYISRDRTSPYIASEERPMVGSYKKAVFARGKTAEIAVLIFTAHGGSQPASTSGLHLFAVVAAFLPFCPADFAQIDQRLTPFGMS